MSTDTPTDTDCVTDSHDTSLTPGDSVINRRPQAAKTTTDSADTDTDNPVTDTAIVTALVAKVADESRERGRLEVELANVTAELTDWQEFAQTAVEEVERLREELAELEEWRTLASEAVAEVERLRALVRH